MNYKCKVCGWEKNQGNYTMTNDEMKEIFAHEKSHEESK